VSTTNSTDRRTRQSCRSEWRYRGWWRRSVHSQTLDRRTDCQWWDDRSTWCQSCGRL